MKSINRNFIAVIEWEVSGCTSHLQTSTGSLHHSSTTTPRSSHPQPLSHTPIPYSTAHYY